jgi:hypothetical protein
MQQIFVLKHYDNFSKVLEQAHAIMTCRRVPIPIHIANELPRYPEACKSLAEYTVITSLLRRSERDHSPTFYNGNTLLALSSVSMKWRIGVLKLVCREAALLHAKILSIPLRCLRPVSRWSSAHRWCDGPDCGWLTGEWMLWFELPPCLAGPSETRFTGYPACPSEQGSRTIESFMQQHPRFKYVVCSLECGEALHRILSWTSFGGRDSIETRCTVLASHEYHYPVPH